MLPGKKYKPEDFLLMAWRRKWFILVPALLVASGVAVYAYLLPNVYRSEAVILVVPQRVPREFVRSTVTTEVDERLQAISQQILSRTRLERIILDLNLYPEERREGIMEEVVQRMRERDIEVNIARPRRGEDSTSFRVGFRYEDPRTAMQVTERLASFFIEENIRDREVLAEGTDQFLQSQLDEARRQLLENEQRLELYKRQHIGSLPTQTQSNLQVLQNSQTQLQSVTESILRDRDQLAILQRLLADAHTDSRAAAPTSAQDPGSLPAAAQLEGARKALAAMRLRLKPEHPDVLRAERTVRELEQKAAAEELAQPLSAGGGSGVPADPQVASRVADLRRQIAQLEANIASRERESDRLRGVIGAYQARVEAAPTRESELVSLTRDYDTLRERYQQLLSKREDAKIAANLERRQIGEQFKIIDAARLPELPESPDRPRLYLMGILAGFGIGLGLAALLEYRDTTLRTEDDVLVTLALPVLATVPQVISRAERHRARRRRLLASAAALAFAVVIAFALVWRLGWLTGRI